MILIIKHVISEGPGTIGDFLKSHSYKLKIVELEKGDLLPESFAGIKAVISMGGPMDVYQEDKFPFLKKEDILIKKAIDNNLPFLGICLGAQLLSKAAGSTVKKDACREIGFFKVELTKEGQKDILFSGVSKNIEVFQWHNDSFDIPKDGVLLAQGEKCKNQAFKIGKCAYGLQFHIEFTPKMIKEWFCDEATRREIEKIENKAADVYKRMFSEYTKILANFCSILDRY